jgi:uncharacterized membrane protein
MQERILSALAEQQSKEAIYLALLQEGHTLKLIDRAYAKAVSTHSQEIETSTIERLLYAGAILIGIGVFAYVAAHWSRYSFGVQLLILICSSMLMILSGRYAEIRTQGILHEALYLLGGMIYGAGVFLIGQRINMPIDWIDAYFIIGLGMSVMGVLLRSQALRAIALLAWFYGLVQIPQVFFPVAEMQRVTDISVHPMYLFVGILWFSRDYFTPLITRLRTFFPF